MTYTVEMLDKLKEEPGSIEAPSDDDIVFGWYTARRQHAVEMKKALDAVEAAKEEFIGKLYGLLATMKASAADREKFCEFAPTLEGDIYGELPLLICPVDLRELIDFDKRIPYHDREEFMLALKGRKPIKMAFE